MTAKANHVPAVSEAEEQILDALYSLVEIRPDALPEEADDVIKAGDRLPPTEGNIRKRWQAIQASTPGEGAGLIDWTGAFEALLEKGLLQLDGSVYTLTDSGFVQAKRIRLERISRWFDDEHIRNQKSRAYSILCERVFGKDLVQANVVDMVQLGKLLEVLALSPKNRVLDLACGAGVIAEYISDSTGAHVLGVDVAAEAIRYAQARTRDKRDRLEFRYGNMNCLDLPPGSVDTVVAIAALHFAEDLDKTIGQLVEIIKPAGQMGLFTFQYASDTDSLESLSSETTKLARVLQSHSLHFQAWDFTLREIETHRKQLQAARDLKEDFRREGNLDFYENVIEESETDLPLLEAGKKRSYLYHVRLG